MPRVLILDDAMIQFNLIMALNLWNVVCGVRRKCEFVGRACFVGVSGIACRQGALFVKLV